MVSECMVSECHAECAWRTYRITDQILRCVYRERSHRDDDENSINRARPSSQTLRTCLFGTGRLLGSFVKTRLTALPWVLSNTPATTVPVLCLFGNGPMVAAFSRTAHPNYFKLNTALPWVPLHLPSVTLIGWTVVEKIEGQTYRDSSMCSWIAW